MLFCVTTERVNSIHSDYTQVKVTVMSKPIVIAILFIMVVTILSCGK